MHFHRAEHEEIRRTLKRFIDDEINPHVDEWEAAEIFPAHQVFKKLGNLGLLGLTKPEAYGGRRARLLVLGADGRDAGPHQLRRVPMAIGVQTDMCTPALARFGSEELRREFLAPAIAGDMVGCIGVCEPGAGSDVAAIKTAARKDGDDYVITGAEDVDHQQPAGRLDVHAGQHRRRAGAQEQEPGDGADGRRQRHRGRAEDPQDRHERSDTGLIYFDEVRVPQRYRIGDEGQGFIYQMKQFQEERLWAAASAPVPEQLHRLDHRVRAGTQALRPPRSPTRSCSSSWPS